MVGDEKALGDAVTFLVLTPTSRIVCTSRLDAHATARRESVGTTADVLVLGALYDAQIAQYRDGIEWVPRRYEVAS